jgi:hypothetical protein
VPTYTAQIILKSTKSTQAQRYTGAGRARDADHRGRGCTRSAFDAQQMKEAVWVKPVMHCTVEYTEKTEQGSIRGHGRFGEILGRERRSQTDNRARDRTQQNAIARSLLRSALAVEISGRTIVCSQD